MNGWLKSASSKDEVQEEIGQFSRRCFILQYNEKGHRNGNGRGGIVVHIPRCVLHFI